MKVNKAQIREAERNRIAKQYMQKIALLEKSIEEHSKLRVEALNKVQKTIEDNLLISARAFPYHYDPNNQTEAYLTSVDEKTEIKENKNR